MIFIYGIYWEAKAFFVKHKYDTPSGSFTKLAFTMLIIMNLLPFSYKLIDRLNPNLELRGKIEAFKFILPFIIVVYLILNAVFFWGRDISKYTVRYEMKSDRYKEIVKNITFYYFLLSIVFLVISTIYSGPKA